MNISVNFTSHLHGSGDYMKSTIKEIIHQKNVELSLCIIHQDLH